MTNIEPKFDPFTDSAKDMPAMVSVWATPGMSLAIFSTTVKTCRLRWSDAASGKSTLDDDPALILIGDKPGRRSLKNHVSQHQQAGVNQEDQEAGFEQPADQPAVTAHNGVESAIEEPEKKLDESCRKMQQGG